MPRDGADQSPDPSESPADLLARAARVRQHARFFVGDRVAEQMEQFADELEARARQIELPGGVSGIGASATLGFEVANPKLTVAR